MPKFVKKPVEIEAVEWTGELASELAEHAGETVFFVNEDGTLSIPTMEGVMTASVGDWIIRGVQGEFYPCKPDIFEQTYEPVVSCDECGYDFDDKLEGCDNCVDEKEN